MMKTPQYILELVEMYPEAEPDLERISETALIARRLVRRLVDPFIAEGITSGIDQVDYAATSFLEDYGENLSRNGILLTRTFDGIASAVSTLHQLTGYQTSSVAVSYAAESVVAMYYQLAGKCRTALKSKYR